MFYLNLTSPHALCSFAATCHDQGLLVLYFNPTRADCCFESVWLGLRERSGWAWHITQDLSAHHFGCRLISTCTEGVSQGLTRGGIAIQRDDCIFFSWIGLWKKKKNYEWARCLWMAAGMRGSARGAFHWWVWWRCAALFTAAARIKTVATDQQNITLFKTGHARTCTHRHTQTRAEMLIPWLWRHHWGCITQVAVTPLKKTLPWFGTHQGKIFEMFTYHRSTTCTGCHVVNTRCSKKQQPHTWSVYFYSLNDVY